MPSELRKMKQQVKIEATHLLFSSANRSFIAAIIVAISLIFLIKDDIPAIYIAAWASLIVFSYLARAVVVRLFIRDKKQTEHMQIWLERFRLATVCCGISWGFAAYFIHMINTMQVLAFVVLILAGVCAGGIINLSLDNKSTALFSAGLWLTAAPAFLLATNTATTTIFIMLAVFILLVGVASKQLAKGLIQSIRLRLDAENSEKEISYLTQRQSLHLEHTPMGIIEWDADLNVTAWNKACVDIFGYSSSEAIGKHISFFMPALDGMQTGHIISRLKQENNQLKKLSNISNQIVHCEFSNTMLHNEHGRFVGMASMVQNKTDFIASQEKIHQLAYFDSLTGLPNRGLLIDRINQTLTSSKRSKSYNMLAFIDLDHFKAINDIKGHNAGDHLLQVIAQRLQDNVRAHDTAARLGGDEFVLVLSDIGSSLQQAELYSKKVIEKIANLINKPVQYENYQHECSASIGICLYNDDSLDATELLRRADVSMYLSKKQGRNAYQFYDNSLQPEYEYQLKLKHDLNHALGNNQFELHLQGQYNRESKVASAEVLLRWKHPEMGMVMPSDFIQLAEETGAIVPIGYWVIKQACGLLKTWQSNPSLNSLMISVNVSAVQFNHADFVKEISEAVRESGCDATKLCLELTESSVITHIEESIKKMHLIKAMGVSLAIDDFGTGYSSLSALKTLPLDELKIDKSFVKDFTKDPVDLTIVQTILQMGKNLHLRIVAEGVETESQMAYLSNYGCSMFQGYFFAEPCTVANFEKVLYEKDKNITPINRASIARKTNKTKPLANTELLTEGKAEKNKQLKASRTEI